MAEIVRGKEDSFRQVQFIFDPWMGGGTSVNVVTVDYRGSKRVAHRIGSVRLNVGRQDLVGLTPGEVTWLLTDALHRWLSANRPTIPGRQAPAPPEGVTGAALLDSQVRVGAAGTRWIEPTLPYTPRGLAQGC